MHGCPASEALINGSNRVIKVPRNYSPFPASIREIGTLSFFRIVTHPSSDRAMRLCTVARIVDRGRRLGDHGAEVGL